MSQQHFSLWLFDLVKISIHKHPVIHYQNKHRPCHYILTNTVIIIYYYHHNYYYASLHLVQPFICLSNRWPGRKNGRNWKCICTCDSTIFGQ